MVQISGKYQAVKSENFAEYLTGLGYPADKAKALADEKTVMVISQDAKCVKIDAQTNPPHTFKWTLNEEVDEELNGSMLKSTAVINGDTLTITSKFKDELSGTRVYKFSDAELVLTLSNTKPGAPIAKRFYKRL